MKKLICIVLALLAMTAVFASCSKKEDLYMDAVLDYYVVRMGNEDFTEKSVKYIGEEQQDIALRKEYRVENEELGISETIYVEEHGMAYMLYDEQGIRIHIYNSATANTTN